MRVLHTRIHVARKNTRVGVQGKHRLSTRILSAGFKNANNFLSAAMVNIDRGTAVIFSTALHVSQSPTIPINESLHTHHKHEGIV